eukprot:358313-Chlamydomonas_euryale.AAC.3
MPAAGFLPPLLPFAAAGVWSARQGLPLVSGCSSLIRCHMLGDTTMRLATSPSSTQWPAAQLIAATCVSGTAGGGEGGLNRLVAERAVQIPTLRGHYLYTP